MENAVPTYEFQGMKRGGNVELMMHDSNWAGVYRHEADLIRQATQSPLLDLYHIGSTAIVGIVAKPIIDILGVWNGPIETFDKLQNALEVAGYIWRGEHGISGRRFLMRVDDSTNATFAHLHVFCKSHPEVARHLCFRDYLRSHEVTAREYSELKLSLLEKFRNDRDAYSAAKNDFIAEVLQKANT